MSFVWAWGSSASWKAYLPRVLPHPARVPQEMATVDPPQQRDQEAPQDQGTLTRADRIGGGKGERAVDKGYHKAPNTLSFTHGARPLKALQTSLFSDQDLDNINVPEVTNDQLTVAAAQATNKYARLVYLFRFRGNAHQMLFNTSLYCTMIIQRLPDQYQLNCITSKVISFNVVNSRTLPITRDATSFLVRLEKLHASFLGPIMLRINHNVITGINWV